MFEVLSGHFSKIFSSLAKKRNLNEKNIAEALSDIKKAFLAGDVDFDVVQNFIQEVKTECIGQQIFKNIQPGQQVVKIVYDKLVATLGGNQCDLDSQRPLSVMMVGLQGSGKTTTSAKLALSLKSKGEKPVLVACDIYRPAAIDQLKVLGKQIGVPVLSYGQIPVLEIAQKARNDAKEIGATVVIFDTAGRLQIDQPLIEEVQQLKKSVCPQEILFVVDSALGQESVNVLRSFHDSLGLTGVVLTKVDGDSKGGVVLSIKRTLNLPIKFVGSGEKLEYFEKFYPDRVASRILGMGDIVSLVEKAQEEMDDGILNTLTQRLLSGDFTFEDFLKQIQQIRKFGTYGLQKWLPFFANSNTLETQEKEIKLFEVIIQSMTPQERKTPNLMNSSYRRARVLKGSGTSVSDFNRFLKRFQGLKKMAQKIKNADPKKLKTIVDSWGGPSFLRKDLFK